MSRRKGRTKSFQIRVDEDCKAKLDQLRDNLSYNQYINHILIDGLEQLEKFKLCSKLIGKIDQGYMAFLWEYERLQKYIKEHETRRE